MRFYKKQIGNSKQRHCDLLKAADFQLLQTVMETAKEAFIAWVGVDPKYASTGISQQLLSELRQRLISRGFTHTWISWEIVDGETSVEELIPELGTVVSTVDMPYFAPGVSSKGFQVPAPHFKRRATESTLGNNVDS